MIAVGKPAQERIGHVDVLLVSMPFGPLLSPSIGLGLLQSALRSRGISCRVLYLTFGFAREVGSRFYQKIERGRPSVADLVGEWIFSGGLFDQSDEQIQRFEAVVLRGGSPYHRRRRPATEDDIRNILRAHRTAPAFLDSCLDSVLQTTPSVIGFTSVFQQHVASLALAKRIKRDRPQTYVVFGGANCEGAMGMEAIRQFPFIDAVVSGEGEHVFPTLVGSVLAKSPPPDLPGVFLQRHTLAGAVVPQPARMIRDLDALPIPCYDDFFDEYGRTEEVATERPRLLLETSRGCWWGEKSHCIFCGLNGATMTFRAKSSARALLELDALAQAHPGCPISVVDNILDLRYFRDFIPTLAEKGLDLELFYEVKANLRRDQIHQLRRAGIASVQPGIESFSTSILRLMRKGVTGLQNIQTLKWCQEFGVKTYWNIIWGFPGECEEEYNRMAEIIPMLSHLDPPQTTSPMRLDRFSPCFADPDRFGIRGTLPYPSYSFVYDLAPDAIENLAYYFTFDSATAHRSPVYTLPLTQQVERWRADHAESALFHLDRGEYLVVWDSRPIALRPVTLLTGLERLLYLECDQMRSAEVLHERLAAGGKSAREAFDSALASLLDARLLIEMDGSYLSLGVCLEIYRPSLDVFRKLGTEIKGFCAERCSPAAVEAST